VLRRIVFLRRRRVKPAFHPRQSLAVDDAALRACSASSTRSTPARDFSYAQFRWRPLLDMASRTDHPAMDRDLATMLREISRLTFEMKDIAGVGRSATVQQPLVQQQAPRATSTVSLWQRRANTKRSAA